MVIPATTPFIFAGFRVAVPVAMIVVVITEMISSADGLGYLVIYSLASLRTDRMLAVVVVIARARLPARQGRRARARPVDILGKARHLLRLRGIAVRARFLLDRSASSSPPTRSRRPRPLIRFGRGFAAEEQVWLMSARPDLTPNQGKRYELKQILFQANPERFQAFLAGELDAGTAPGLAVIFARAQGVDMKIVASVCLEAGGQAVLQPPPTW